MGRAQLPPQQIFAYFPLDVGLIAEHICCNKLRKPRYTCAPLYAIRYRTFIARIPVAVKTRAIIMCTDE